MFAIVLIGLCTYFRISNAKPSAIFRVRNAFATKNTGMLALGATNMPGTGDSDAVLGISIEHLDSVLAQVASLHVSGSESMSGTTSTALLSRSINLSDPTYLAQKIIQHLFNFLSSFSSSSTPSGSVLIRMADLRSWYERLVAKIKNGGTAFLDRED